MAYIPLKTCFYAQKSASCAHWSVGKCIDQQNFTSVVAAACRIARPCCPALFRIGAHRCFSSRAIRLSRVVVRVWRCNGKRCVIVFIRELWAQPPARLQNPHRKADQAELCHRPGGYAFLLLSNRIVFFRSQYQRRGGSAGVSQPAPGIAAWREYPGVPRRLADAHRRPAPAGGLQGYGAALQALFPALPAKQRLRTRSGYPYDWPQFFAQWTGEAVFPIVGLSHLATHRQRRSPACIPKKSR